MGDARAVRDRKWHQRQADAFQQPLEGCGRREERPFESGRLAPGDDLAEKRSDNVRGAAGERGDLEDLLASHPLAPQG